jgi:putative transcriptional regulator
MLRKGNDDELAKDLKAWKLEEKGVETGRFRKSSRVIPVKPEEVRKARAAAGMSQPAFAEALGLSPKTIQAWEQGVRRPDGLASKLIRLMTQERKVFERLARA